MYFPKLVSLTDMMIFHCWSFIEFLCLQSVAVLIKDKNNKGDIQSFSDDILIHILSRLPAESVLQCRRVCKRWRSLTSTSHFIELQFQTAKPLIIVNDYYLIRLQGERYLLSTDEATRKLTVTPVCRYLKYLMDNEQIENSEVLCSCHGLILWRAIKPSISSFIYFICNPFTREMITLPIFEEGVYVCGFFFHPLSMEHRVLCRYRKGEHSGFKIFSLETNSWRDLSCGYNVELASSDIMSANGRLHWFILGSGILFADFILRYDINLEVFDTIPRPKCEKYPEKIHRVQLFEVEGEICYCCSESMSSDEVIKIWVLAAKNHWVKRYEINLGDQLKRYSSSDEYYPFMRDLTMIIGIYNDELVFQWSSRGLFSYNLRRGSVRKIEIDGKPRKIMHNWRVILYKKSLVSLKQCLQVLKGKQMEGRKWRGMDGYNNYLLFLVQDLIGLGEQ